MSVKVLLLNPENEEKISDWNEWKVFHIKHDNITWLTHRPAVSPLVRAQLKVLPRDLQLCSETASGVDAGGQHEWGELVQLDPQTVGVIVRLERETFQVIVWSGMETSARWIQTESSLSSTWRIYNGAFSERRLRPSGVEHAWEGPDSAPPGGESQEGQPLCRGAGLGAEQHPRQGHCEGHRRAALCKDAAHFSVCAFNCVFTGGRGLRQCFIIFFVSMLGTPSGHRHLVSRMSVCNSLRVCVCLWRCVFVCYTVFFVFPS